MYRTKFVTLRCLYQEILSIHCRISESKVFQKYETIVRHMRDVFFIINQLKENKFNDEDDNGRLLLEEYYKNTHMYIIGQKICDIILKRITKCSVMICWIQNVYSFLVEVLNHCSPIRRTLKNTIRVLKILKVEFLSEYTCLGFEAII